MIIQFFRHGEGSGKAPVEYLVASHAPIWDEDGRPVRDADGHVIKVKREPSPKVLRGDAQLVCETIDSVEHKWKYTSGVLSWAPEDRPSGEQLEEVLKRFEQTFLAGLQPVQYQILWVEHLHAGHQELHF